MNKILCTSKNSEAKTLPADVCVFGHFGHLLPAAVHSADCWFDSKVKWWIHISSIVTYLCKNSFLLHWNSSKQRSELSMHCCFWLTVSKHGTHFEHSFLIDKCSSSFVPVWPCLKSAYHLLTIFFFPSENNALSTHEIQIFPLFWKFASVALLK